MSLADLVSGTVPGALVSGGDVPDPLPPGLAMTVPGPTERRFVLLGVESPGRLAPGSPVGVPDQRLEMLVRARHPELEPVPGTPDVPVRLVALWTDPSLESRGELLERDGWLPGPGEGIGVFLHRAGSPGAPDGDPSAAAVLSAERALARRFPGPGLSIMGQAFAGSIRLRALLLSADGRRAVRAEGQGPIQAPGAVASRVADLLDARGADLLRAPVAS